MKAYLIYRFFLDEHGNAFHLGGIENYMLALAKHLITLGYEVEVVQTAKQAFATRYHDIKVSGFSTKGFHGNRKKIALWRHVEANLNEDDIVIFATDTYTVKTKHLKVIAIQHGISWDKPRGNKPLWIQRVKSWLNQRRYLQLAQSSKNLVCVDHNFVNWFRTQCDFSAGQNVWVIPNFATDSISAEALDIKLTKSAEQSKRLLIARRFVEYRGVGLAIDVVRDLLQKHPSLEVTFAGSGPMSKDISAAFGQLKNVKMIRYYPEETLEIMTQHDVMLLPSIGSEGTSLSLLEGMAAGCAVVCTNVGGQSNIVIDNHNGRICMPQKAELVAALDTVLADDSLRFRLAKMAWQTINSSFSLSRWQQQWTNVFKQLS